MKYTLGNAQHIGSRQEQQDCFAFSNFEDKAFVKHGGVLAVLADGMGGLQNGGAAARTAIQTFLGEYRKKSPDDPIPQVLKKCVRKANDAVVAFARSAGSEGNTGATIVAVVLRDREMYWVSAGDSRAYLWRDGRLYRLTRDHTYGTELDDQVASGTLDRETAESDPERESVTNFLGMPEGTAPDCAEAPFALREDDRMLLCSDGLYRTLLETEIAQVLEEDLQRNCDRLIKMVLKKNVAGQDNVSVVMLAARQNSQNLASRLHLAVWALLVVGLIALAWCSLRIGEGRAVFAVSS